MLLERVKYRMADSDNSMLFVDSCRNWCGDFLFMEEEEGVYGSGRGWRGEPVAGDLLRDSLIIEVLINEYNSIEISFL